MQARRRIGLAIREQTFDTGLMGASAIEILKAQGLTVAPVVLAKEQLLAVPEPFHSLLPGAGLQRGWTVRIEGAVSSRVLAWALLSKVTRSGGWVAIVDVPGLALSAAREVGLAIERVIVVSSMGSQAGANRGARGESEAWSSTIDALIGSVDAIVFGSPRHRITPSTYRKMASRCRERGTVMVELAWSLPDSRSRSRSVTNLPEVDVSFQVTTSNWEGVGEGHGRVVARRLDVLVTGRRVSGRERQGRLALPDTDGVVRSLVEPDRTALSVVKSS